MPRGAVVPAWEDALHGLWEQARLPAGDEPSTEPDPSRMRRTLSALPRPFCTVSTSVPWPISERASAAARSTSMALVAITTSSE